MSHGFVRIAGHGIRLLPTAPFAVRAVDAALEVVVADDAGDFVDRVDGTTERKSQRYGDVFAGPESDHWQLEVGGVYTARWPTALSLSSWPEPDQPPFFMLGDDNGSLVYVQGPFAPGRAPQISKMCGAGQRELARSTGGPLPWIDLAYEHRGAEWRQRHVLAQLGTGVATVVTAQMPARLASSISTLAVEFASSLAPYSH